MSVRKRLLSFGVALVLAFGSAFAVGALLRDRSEVSVADRGNVSPSPQATAPATARPAAVSAGLNVSEAGYTLSPLARLYDPYVVSTLRFNVLGPDGRPAQEFRPVRDQPAQLVLLRRDLTGYQRLSPELAEDGEWSTPMVFPSPGTYRMYVEVAPSALTDRPSLVLGADLFVSGPTSAEPLPEQDSSAEVGGMDVELAGSARASGPSELRFTISRDGKPVQALQASQGSFGYLVAIREGDLAYTQALAQPASRVTDVTGPELSFAPTLPGPGRYAVFLDFREGDIRHDARFVLDATGLAVARDASRRGG